MSNKKVSIYLVLIFISINTNCQNIINNNRAYFNINPKDRKIVLPVQVKDSTTARLEFDTGGSLILDSIFCKTHLNFLLKNDSINNKISGVGWTSQRTLAIIPEMIPKLSVGGTELEKAEHLEIWNWGEYMHTTNSDGMFNIPANDTTNIWELNFENNYLEIHSNKDFVIPKNHFFVPIVKDKFNPQRFIINSSLKVECMDGDTTTLNGNFLIDTAMPWDIAILHKTGDLPFFNNRTDAVWTGYVNDYYRYYNVNVSLFNEGFSADSVRVYSFEYPDCMKSYILGINFLKRFNLFFDLKNKRVAFQPIKNFHRVVDPTIKRFHISTFKSSNGEIYIKNIATNKENYFYIAGLRKGDKIFSINGKTKENDMNQEFQQKNKLLFVVIRNGKKIRAEVHVNRTEITGD
jgi:hypothetical protein